MDLYGGIDVGLSGLRTTIVSATGRLVASHRIAAKTDTMSADEIVTHCCKSFRQLMRSQESRRGQEILGLGITCFGPSPVLLGRAGQELLRVPLFQTHEGEGPQDDLLVRLKDARSLYRRSFSAAASCCDLTGFVVKGLTDVDVIDSITANDFHPAASFLPGLPAIRPADSIAGVITAAAARRLGLQAGTPVTVGCYDSTADIAAAGFGAKRPSIIVLGSTLVIGRLSEAPVSAAMLRSMPHIGRGFFCGGWTNMAGSAIALAEKWFQSAKATSAGAVPLILPYFAGERAPVWNLAASGAVVGLTSEMFARDLHRGVIEGVALSALDIAERLQQEMGAAKRWTVIGGGTRNAELMQTLADALDATLDTVRHAGDAMGPALLAARATGNPITLPIARSWRPRRARHLYLARRLCLYRRCNEALAPLYAELRNHYPKKGKPK